MAKAGVSGTAASLLAFVALALGGCATKLASSDAAGTAVAPPFHVVPGSLLLPAAPSPPGQRDTCGASALAGLVGKPRTQIPVPVDLSRRRVVCTACPVAPDVRMDRLNIFYDARTGLVTKVSCG
jgi:hypothetical protein